MFGDKVFHKRSAALQATDNLKAKRAALFAFATLSALGTMANHIYAILGEYRFGTHLFDVNRQPQRLIYLDPDFPYKSSASKANLIV